MAYSSSSGHLAAFAPSRSLRLLLSIGVNERVKEGPGHGTLYNSNLLFNSESILLAEIDVSAITKESLTLDVTGHYARPDIFDLRFKPSKPVDS